MRKPIRPCCTRGLMKSLKLTTFALVLCLGTAPLTRVTADAIGTGAGDGRGDSEASEGRDRRLSILIISSFYSGHIIPLLAVGEELVSREHHVSFLTTEINRSNLIPRLPREIGMTFISAGPDPRTKLEYENVIYNLMGRTPTNQINDILMLARDHTLPLRAACDKLNITKYDIIIADVVAVNLIRYLDIKWGPKIILSIAVAGDFVSIDSNWPSPSIQCVDCSEDMSFLQRLITSLYYKNPLIQFFSTRSMKTYLASNDEIIFPYITHDPLKNFLPDEFHPSLMYTAVGVEYARNFYPGVHMVGTVLRRKIPPLAEDLESWLAKKAGKVIYVSMGTTALVTEAMAKGFVEGVLATEYSVVWSLRESNQNVLKGMVIDPSRFYIANWVSQVAAFQHEAVELAILHCGTGGIHEALYFEVPMICVPFWHDQFSWANRIRDQGLGLVLYADDISSQTIADSIHKIKSGTFREKAVLVSKILKQAGGSAKAADLVEYYAEVGYGHLVPSYMKYEWSWIQYYNMDVYVVVLSGGGVTVCVLWRLYICLVTCNSRHKTKND